MLGTSYIYTYIHAEGELWGKGRGRVMRLSVEDEVKRYEDEVKRYEDEVPGRPPPRAAHARAPRAFHPQPSICERLPLL